MQINEMFYFDESYKEKAKWCNENNCHIEEIEGDENGRKFVILENQPVDKAELFRALRHDECFEIVNRGKVWYDTLSQAQLDELNTWYQAWLDAPATLVMPKTPNWIK
ncbi:MAG: hypothetical protein IJZ62_03470 [Clostridia bacterium]|nr:hypothetical protein [Clostridia bacterium]